MRDTILYDSAMRLFGDHVSPRVIADAEAGTWPDELWRQVEKAGFLDVLVEGAVGMAEAATILRAAGYHAAPLPLAETMLGRWLCAAAGLEVPAGPLTAAPAQPEDRLSVSGDSVAGQAGRIPWGRNAAALALLAGESLCLLSGAAARFELGVNLAGEPRDSLVMVDNPQIAELPEGVHGERVLELGALMRAAQMAGAMEAALDLSVRYANDRVQFGRPIGKFQAVQQQMALLAEETAAALVGVESAALAVSEARVSAGIAIAAAKIRTGEAAGKVAEIAHQVHGAIGFTEEHSLHHLTRRLWSWRDEFGDETWWALRLGRRIAEAGPDGLWPLIAAR